VPPPAALRAATAYPIYFGGASDAAIAVSAKHADVYALWEKPRPVREITAACNRGRQTRPQTVRVSLSLRPISRRPRMRRGRGEAIKQRIIERRAAAGLGPDTSQRGIETFARRGREGASASTSVCGWVGLLTGASGNSTSLVGTPQQVAEALCEYYDLGVTTFLIRGFDLWLTTSNMAAVTAADPEIDRRENRGRAAGLTPVVRP